MPPRPQGIVRIRQFTGLVTAADRLAIPATAAVRQVNATCRRPGRLEVRRGLKPIRWEN